MGGVFDSSMSGVVNQNIMDMLNWSPVRYLIIFLVALGVVSMLVSAFKKAVTGEKSSKPYLDQE